MAQQTVVGIFDSADDAARAVRELSDAGFSREHVDVATRGASASGASYGSTPGASTDTTPDWNDRNTSGTAVEGAVDYAGRKAEEGGSAIGRFFRDLFTDDDDTYGRYATVAERSNSIVTVHAHSDENAETAREILDRCGAIDVDDRASQYGYSGYGDAASTRQGLTGATEQKVDVIQEDLRVGKREVETGGVRLRSRVVSRPVEETLRLREEHVFVNRQPVDRPATDADFNAFREGTVELTETAEVPVVQKEARVVEEVSLGKQVEERTETIRDSVRSTEVDVERIEGDERSTGYNSASSNPADR